ncbi:MAG TPA: peptidase S16, partial [Actinotalea sp.]|nr:peptidase S16 [Actinotalea sp.]
PPPLDLDETTVAALDEAEALVRATLTRASEFVELPWSPDVELSAETSERLWQVAAIAPVGALDQLTMLRSPTAADLLATLVDETRASAERFASWPDWPDGPDGPDGPDEPDDDLLG